MISNEFNAGIEELRDIFPRFKLSAEGEKGWFLKLRHHSREAMAEAVKWLTDREETPSFFRLKHALSIHRTKGGERTEIQALAPKGDEFNDFVGSHMAGLRLMMAEKNKAKRDRLAAELKKTWAEGYKHLPGYKSEAEIRRLIRGKKITRLRIKTNSKGQIWAKRIQP